MRKHTRKTLAASIAASHRADPKHFESVTVEAGVVNFNLRARPVDMAAARRRRFTDADFGRRHSGHFATPKNRSYRPEEDRFNVPVTPPDKIPVSGGRRSR